MAPYETTYEQQTHHLVYHRSSVRIIVWIDISPGGRKLSTKMVSYEHVDCFKSASKRHASYNTGAPLAFRTFKQRWQLQQKERRYIRYLPPRRSVLGTTEPEVSNMSRSRGPRAILETSGTVFPYTDRTRPAYNLFIFFYGISDWYSRQDKKTHFRYYSSRYRNPQLFDSA